MTPGYDSIYAWLIPKLAACDLAESAARVGLSVDEGGGARVNFLGREFRVTGEGVEPLDGLPADSNTRSVLAYYLLAEGAGNPTGNFAPLFRLTGMLEGRNSQDVDLMSGAVLRKFGADPAGFEAAALRLGAVREPAKDAYCHSLRIDVLPKIPVRLVLYEADEEFPADFQIFCDETAPRFLEFECLAFMTGCLIQALVGSSSPY